MACFDFDSIHYAAYLNHTTNFIFQSDVPDSDRMTLLLVVFVAVISFVIISNSMLIYALFNTSRPFSKTTGMFLCLSFVDMLSVITNVIHSLLFAYFPNGLCILNLILYMLSSSLVFLGINIFLSISILRCLALTKPFLQVDMRIVWSVNFVIFFLSNAYNLVSFLLSPSRFFERKFRTDQISLGIFILFCILLILTINIVSYRAILTSGPTCTNKERNSANPGADGDIQNNSSSGHYKKHAVKTLIIITSFYLISNIPMVLFALLGQYLVEVTATTAWIYLYLLVLVNCGMNAVIYMIRTKKVRKFLYCRLTRAITLGTKISL